MRPRRGSKLRVFEILVRRSKIGIEDIRSWGVPCPPSAVMCFTIRIVRKRFHTSSWLVALLLVDSLFVSYSGDGLSSSTYIKDTPTTVGLSYLELLKSGGRASWSEVDNISRILAKGDNYAG